MRYDDAQKEIGAFNLAGLLEGLEGFSMALFTRVLVRLTLALGLPLLTTCAGQVSRVGTGLLDQCEERTSESKDSYGTCVFML